MLTRPQRRAYLFIVDFIASKRVSPTVREIGRYLGSRSPGSPFGILMSLEERGYIRRQASRHRSIEVLRRPVVTCFRFDDEMKALVPLRPAGGAA